MIKISGEIAKKNKVIIDENFIFGFILQLQQMQEAVKFHRRFT